jgi:hypothetical protein
MPGSKPAVATNIKKIFFFVIVMKINTSLFFLYLQEDYEKYQSMCLLQGICLA